MQYKYYKRTTKISNKTRTTIQIDIVNIYILCVPGTYLTATHSSVEIET